MARKKPVSEQVVVIGGGSYGLGRAIAREAARKGAKVVIGARTAEALAGALADIEAGGAEGLTVETDVSRRDQVERLTAAAVERFGRIDTYVANAMVTVYSEAHLLEDDELRRVFDVNFFGGVYGYWASLPYLRDTRGTFVQVASALSYRGIPLQAAYCATKAALRTFYETARVELEKERAGVDVCVVLPGAINTPQFDRARQRIGFQPQPVPPIYQPEAFSAAVVRCCERPVRELPLGWGAQKAIWGEKLTPRFADLVLRRTGWKSQHTDEPKPIGSPDSLFQPLPGDPGARGRFSAQSRDSTVWTWLRLHRPLIAAGLALGTMGQLLGGRSGRFSSSKGMSQSWRFLS
jgi:NAD(P)-dependent dehydrogenase (short-subunit alcohol dehydrogenase family)